MNKRQVIILWVIAIALGVAVAAIKLTRDESNQSATKRTPGETLLESFPANDVAAIEIKGVSETVNLARKDGRWTVVERDGYPANATYVNDFLRTLGELKVTLGMEAGPTFASRFGMDQSSTNPGDRGLTATFKDAAGKEVAVVSLGKSIESGAAASPMGGGNAVGRYVRNHADESGFYAVGEMFPAVNAEAVRWLATGFFSPEKIKSISLSKPGSDEIEWKVERADEEAEFKLEGATGPEVLDTTAASPLKTLFSYSRFEDVVPADRVAGREDPEARQTAVIETFEGFVYTVTVSPIKESKVPAALNPDGPNAQPSDNYLLTVSVTADIPKERKKPEDEKPEDAEAKDKAFTERTKTLTEKLEKEKSIAGRTFEVSKSTVEPLLKARADLIAKPTPPPAADNNGGSVQQLPGGIIATPPVQAVTPPIQAVTPPIAVPPLDQDETEEEERFRVGASQIKRRGHGQSIDCDGFA